MGRSYSRQKGGVTERTTKSWTERTTIAKALRLAEDGIPKKQQASV